MAVMSTMSRVIAVPFVAMTLTLHGCSTSDCTAPDAAGYSDVKDNNLAMGDAFDVTVGGCDANMGYSLKSGVEKPNATVCEEAGKEYTLAGCEATECARPDSADDIAKKYKFSASAVFTQAGFSVKYQCQDGYSKEKTGAEAESDAKACSANGKPFEWATDDECKKLPDEVDCGDTSADDCEACTADNSKPHMEAKCKGQEGENAAYTGKCAEVNKCTP